MAIITITNETGCGEMMYTTVAKMLDYKLVNRELIKYVAGISGLSEKDLEMFDDKKHSTFGIWAKSYLGMFTSSNASKTDSRNSSSFEYDNSPSGENFKNATEKVMKMLANQDNVIVVGRGGNIVLAGYPKLINIYLCADIEQRAKNISISIKMSHDDAVKYAKETDEKKRKFVEYYYKESIDDIHNYDIVFNLSRVSEENAADIVCDMIRDSRFK